MNFIMKSMPWDKKRSAWLQKSLIIMRCIFLFLLLGTLQITASVTYSQSVKLSLDVRNRSVQEVLSIIEQKSSFYFTYNLKQINADRKVSVSVDNKSIEDVLNELFLRDGVKYVINDTHIVLYKTDKEYQAALNQQKKIITGTVTDASGEPAIGVNIIEKGSTNGAITDLEGHFSLPVSANSILQISYIGYIGQEIAVKNQTNLLIQLKEDSQTLEEVVVVGYGTQKKENLTGAVSSVSLNNVPTLSYNNSSSMLAGKVPGVFVTQNSGQPGRDNATVRIRGVGTMNDSNPLILIDGMEGDLNAVDPKDIESISVLKDASSAAIYGNRAANGVIIVTTKKGKKNEKLSINYNGSVGFQLASRIPDTFNAYEHALLYNEALINCGMAKIYTDEDVQKFKLGTEDGYKDTNWAKLFYDGAKPVTTHNLSLKGGGERIASFLSLGYLYQEGIRYKQSYDRINIRSNTQAYFLKDDKLSVQFLLDFTRGMRNDGLAKYQTGSALDDASPTMQLKYNDPDDPSKQVFGSYSGLYFAAIDQGAFYKETNYNLNGKALLNYEIVKNLNLHFEYGASYELTDLNQFVPAATGYYFWSDVFHSWGSSAVNRNHGNSLHTTLNAYADYSLEIAKEHRFKFLVGFSQEEKIYNKFSAGRNNLVSNSFPQLILGDVETATNSSDAWEYALRSGFGRFTYDYKDKYLFEANVRYDGSSRFAPGKRWGVFPSFSAGWRMKEESFFKDVERLDNLKLRVSWGKLGNQNVDYYATSDLIKMGANSILNNALSQGATLNYLADKSLSWETITQANLGIDAGFLEKFNAQLDVYTKTASDVLRQLPVPATTGVTSAAWRNIAKVKNTGFDFNIQYATDFGSDWQFSANLGLSHFRNEIVDMGEIGTQYSNVNIITEGEPYLAYYGLEVGGIVRSPEELKKIPTQILNTQVGDLWYKDQDGDGKVTTMDDRTIIGTPYPDFSYSLQLDVKWKGLALSTLIQGEQGLDQYCSGAVYDPFTWGYTTGAWWKDRWTPENPNASMPRLWVNQIRSLASDFYVQDASYLRFKNISLSYTFPKSFTSKIGIDNLMVYSTAYNAITITKFKGYDPERTLAGSGFNSYPQVQSYTFGIQVGF